MYGLFFCLGCGETDFEWEYTTHITFINETDYVIRTSDDLCDVPNILENSTLTYEHTEPHFGTKKSDQPNLDNIETFVPCVFFYGSTPKCETGVNEVENHENRKQIGEFEFEYTFRFTEERFQNAPQCQ